MPKRSRHGSILRSSTSGADTENDTHTPTGQWSDLGENNIPPPQVAGDHYVPPIVQLLLVHPRVRTLSDLPPVRKRQRLPKPKDYFYTFTVHLENAIIFMEQGLPDGTSRQTSIFECPGGDHSCRSRFVYAHRWRRLNINIWWRCPDRCGGFYIFRLETPKVSFEDSTADRDMIEQAGAPPAVRRREVLELVSKKRRVE